MTKVVETAPKPEAALALPESRTLFQSKAVNPSAEADDAMATSIITTAPAKARRSARRAEAPTPQVWCLRRRFWKPPCGRRRGSGRCILRRIGSKEFESESMSKAFIFRVAFTSGSFQVTSRVGTDG